MSNHYYDQNPTSEHDEKTISFKFKNKELKFITDAGVFSKNKVDFGSVLLINTFYNFEAKKILDMGCGYGPIGVSISSELKSGEITLVDINERAVNLVNRNILVNRHLIPEEIKLISFRSDGFERVEDKDYDVIFINPPIRAGKSVVYKLYDGAYKHLTSNGELWIVIQKKQGAPSSIAKLESLFSSVEVIKRSKGYYIVMCKK